MTMGNENPRVAVIVPSWNGEADIRMSRSAAAAIAVIRSAPVVAGVVVRR